MCDNNYYIPTNDSAEIQSETDSDVSQIREIIETAGDIADAAKLLIEEFKKNYRQDEEDDE